MNVLVLPLSFWLAAAVFCCTASAEIITARSSSRQFLAREIQGPASPLSAPESIQTRMANGWGFLLVARRNGSDTDPSSIQLEPSLLVVSCERLKSLFLAQLGLDDQWQGRVTLLINPALDEHTEPRLTAMYYPDGWTYSLELPKTISTRLLVLWLMQTLFLEMANRGARAQSAEIPFWLVEGMSAHLQSFNLPTFLLQPDEQMSGNKVKLEGLDKVREQLRRHSPLSFQELSWPTSNDMTGEGLELYRSCAQLFLEQLLEFPDGKQLLTKMVRQLPDYLNWQTAFLSAFRPHFHQLLDVEKWWGLSYVDFTRGDLAEPLTAEAGWQELRDVLDVPVQVHFSAETMPTEARLTLQEVIAKWPSDDAIPAVERSVEELKTLHLRVSPQLRPLVDQYLKVLASYLVYARDPTLEWEVANHHPSPFSRLKSDAISQLDALDKQRSALRVAPGATAANAR